MKVDTLWRRCGAALAWLTRGALAVALLGLLAAPACTSPEPRTGRLAPDFTLTDLEGNSVTLSDFRGKVVFLNFWATWCPPCRAEMPAIEAIHQKYKNKDVVVIGIDLREDENAVRQFVEQGGFSWTFVIDTTGEVADSYAVTAIPASFFLDTEGVIRAVNVGALTERAMESQLAKAMK